MIPYHAPDRLQVPPAEILNSIFRRRHVGSMLEVGCGIGGILSQFDSVFYRVGIDINAAEVQKAQEMHPGLAFMVADATRLSELYPPGHFEAVFAADVLEHFEKEVSVRVLEQMEKVASRFVAVWSPEGEAGMVDFNATCDAEGEPHCHLCVITEEEFADRGYMTMVFPSYWKRYYVDSWTADGLLAIKQLGE